MTSALIDAQSVYKTFDTRHGELCALQDFSLKIQVVGIVVTKKLSLTFQIFD